MAEWNKKHHGRIQQSAVLYLSIVMYEEKLHDFKWTAKRKVYNWGSKPERVPFFRTSKKTCFLNVVKRRVTKEPLNSEFLDEIYFTIFVYK